MQAGRYCPAHSSAVSSDTDSVYTRPQARSARDRQPTGKRRFAMGRKRSPLSLRIAHNLEAMYAHRNLAISSSRLATSMQRLSSGLRINSAADDPAGLAISEKMRAQIRGLHQAQRNTQDGISLLQTIDGALSEVHSILQRARELAVQFNNGTVDAAGKNMIAMELASLSDEIGRIGNSTEFNGIKLLQGGLTNVTLQVGANSGDTIAFATATLMGTVNALCNRNDFFLLPFMTADLSVFDTDIARVSQARANYGALQNRLEHSLAQSSSYAENLMSAESRIRDTDMAMEITNLTRHQIMVQSGTAMLAAAQRSADGVLQLLAR